MFGHVKKKESSRLFLGRRIGRHVYVCHNESVDTTGKTVLLSLTLADYPRRITPVTIITQHKQSNKAARELVRENERA